MVGVLGEWVSSTFKKWMRSKVWNSLGREAGRERERISNIPKASLTRALVGYTRDEKLASRNEGWTWPFWLPLFSLSSMLACLVASCLSLMLINLETKTIHKAFQVVYSTLKYEAHFLPLWSLEVLIINEREKAEIEPVELQSRPSNIGPGNWNRDRVVRNVGLNTFALHQIQLRWRVKRIQNGTLKRGPKCPTDLHSNGWNQ